LSSAYLTRRQGPQSLASSPFPPAGDTLREYLDEIRPNLPTSSYLFANPPRGPNRSLRGRYGLGRCTISSWRPGLRQAWPVGTLLTGGVAATPRSQCRRPRLRSPGLHDEIVQRPRPIATAEAPVAPWVATQVLRRRREIGPYLVEVLPERVRQQVGNGDDREACGPCRRVRYAEPQIDLLGAQVHQSFMRKPVYRNVRRSTRPTCQRRPGCAEVHSMMESASGSL